MKVAANNDPATCSSCHEFESGHLAILCAELLPAQDSIVHAVPGF